MKHQLKNRTNFRYAGIRVPSPSLKTLDAVRFSCYCAAMSEQPISKPLAVLGAVGLAVSIPISFVGNVFRKMFGKRKISS